MNQVIEILQKEIPGLSAIYLFGSRSKGQARSDSDTDIAYLSTGPAMPAVDRFFLAQQLADILNTDVDLVDLRAASTILRFEIIGKGKRIFCQDETICDLFEITVFSMYQRFQEERKAIVEEILQKRTIYG